MKGKRNNKTVMGGVAAAIMAGMLMGATGGESTEMVDPRMDGYAPIESLSGSVTCTGSAIVSNLLNRWASEFHGIYPGVKVTVNGADSSAAPAALMEGKAEIGQMSRPMSAEEKGAFAKKFGNGPLEVAVAVDALAVYVEKENPVASLSLQQLDGIFSRTFKRGGGALRRWRDVGVSGDLGEMAIVRYANDGDRGTVSVFSEEALDGGALGFDVVRLRGSSSVVQGVAVDPAGIGFASTVFKTKRTRQVPLVNAKGEVCAPTYENVVTQRYPLTRFLYLYVNKAPGKGLSPVVGEFLRYVLSRDGQRRAASGGNMPLTNEIVVKERGALGE